MRYGLDLAHIKDAQIGLPAMKLEERVVIAAEVLRQCGLTRDDLIKHSADCSTIDHTGCTAKPIMRRVS